MSLKLLFMISFAISLASLFVPDGKTTLRVSLLALALALLVLGVMQL